MSDALDFSPKALWNKLRFYRSVVVETAWGLLAWAMFDLFLAVLPLLVLIFVAELFALGPDPHFWALPEWSFATIVLLAASLRDVIHLKVDIQKADRQWTIAAIMFVVGQLIFSSLVLGAIYSARAGARISLEAVASCQETLFYLAVIQYVIFHWFRGKDFVSKRDRCKAE